MIICAYLVAYTLNGSMPPMVAVGHRPDGVQRKLPTELDAVPGILAEEGWGADDWVTFDRIELAGMSPCAARGVVQIEGSLFCLLCARVALHHLTAGRGLWRW